MKTILIILFLFISFRLYAPVNEGMLIFKSDGINPFEQIWKAICQVESSNNPLAYHLEKNGHASIGIAQIQQSRVDHYNYKTNNHYTLDDMYDTTISRNIFMWYACYIGPYNIEKIAREWNGGTKGMKKRSTIKYWNKVKILL